MLDGPKSPYRPPSALTVATAEEGRRAVAMLKAGGVDFIKVQSLLSPEVYFAITAESQKQGLPVAGHVPPSVHAHEALAAGQTSIDHLTGIVEDGIIVDNEAALVSVLVKNRTWQCPTLYGGLVGRLVDTLDVMNDPNSKYVPSFWPQTFWRPWARNSIRGFNPLPQRKEAVMRDLDMVRRLHEAGVPFLAGTDAPAGIALIPGFTVHAELERFVAAGLTPLEALQTATINPAEFLGRMRDFGTIEKGKIADLVLLDSNPLEDIRSTRSIQAVVANGRYIDRRHLDGILDAVENAAERY
jgi:imidazolonepropionase-like amidohydrolase